ncbi:MAG TPA: toll/interleukin-1 receptor domain-containing protein [Pyrinomonadaceae bacterium]|nr:toll/interleukin-1 receptor domain-containing protein [Pyrinomonadaceae bacterium]
MADHQQLEILWRGVPDWNEWRTTYHGAFPDLTDARLIKADLRGANLSGAALGGARLTGANLSGADLRAAALSGANLEGAVLSGVNLNHAYLLYTNLTNAILSHADITDANLTGARLAGANLTGADSRGSLLLGVDFSDAILSGADFSGADFSGTILSRTALSQTKLHNARIGETVFADLDLREAEGLDSVHHLRPSDISLRTIYMSEGNIPEPFLRGCGVPESFITQMLALVGALQPIQFYSCFISYSSRNEELAQRLYADLQSRGVRCWFAPEDLKIGERFRRRIDEVIRVYDRLLLILSENSVASSWVEKEVETAMESEAEQHRTVLFPVRLDDSVMEIKTGWPADVRRTRHIGDFRRWKEHDEYRKAFARLLADLKASA